MNEPMRYETREAIASLMVAMAGGQAEPNVRECLATLTDIPADRLDKATAEISECLPDLFGVVTLMKLCGNNVTVETALETVTTAPWIDDDNGTVTTNTTLIDEASGAEAKISMSRKLDGGAH